MCAQMNNITAKSIIVTQLEAERTRIQNSSPLYSTKRVCEDLILTKACQVPTQIQQQHALNSLPAPLKERTALIYYRQQLNWWH